MGLLCVVGWGLGVGKCGVFTPRAHVGEFVHGGWILIVATIIASLYWYIEVV